MPEPTVLLENVEITPAVIGYLIWAVPLVLSPIFLLLSELPYLRLCSRYYRVRFPLTAAERVKIWRMSEMQMGYERTYDFLISRRQPIPELEAARRKATRPVIYVIAWACTGWILPVVLGLTLG